MARVPFSSLDGLASPGTISVPDAYQRVPTDPAAFGGSEAQALQKFGQGVEQAAGTVMGIANREQQLHDQTAVLAYYKAMQGDTNAVESAYQGILGKRYDFNGTMRAPKGDMPAVRTAAQSVLGALTPADMPVLASSTLGLSDEDKRQSLFSSVRAFGQWVPMPDDGGLQLIVRTNNNQLVAISRADGTPVAVRFDRLRSYAAFGENDLGEVLRTGP